MKTTRMATPTSRAEFERNLFLLAEKMAQGKFSIARGLGIDGLLRVRHLPNGRVDLLSIDEATRLKANMMNQMLESFPPSEAEPMVDEDATIDR